MEISHLVIIVIAGSVGVLYMCLLLYKYNKNLPYINGRVIQDPSIRAPSAPETFYPL